MRDATMSSPSSRFASVNESREHSCAWSPAASHVTGASADPIDGAAYGNIVDEDTVNQSLNASMASVGSALDGRSSGDPAGAPSRIPRAPSPPRERPSPGVDAVQENQLGSPSRLSASLSSVCADEPTDVPGGTRHRGTIAARALMGRKRVYGAVVIQQWFRRMLHRKKQQERNTVKSMLRERRERKEAEAELRAM